MKFNEIRKLPKCEHCGKHFYKGLNLKIKTIADERYYRFCGNCLGHFVQYLLNDRIVSEHILQQFKRV